MSCISMHCPHWNPNTTGTWTYYGAPQPYYGGTYNPAPLSMVYTMDPAVLEIIRQHTEALNRYAAALEKGA